MFQGFGSPVPQIYLCYAAISSGVVWPLRTEPSGRNCRGSLSGSPQLSHEAIRFNNSYLAQSFGGVLLASIASGAVGEVEESNSLISACARATGKIAGTWMRTSRGGKRNAKARIAAAMVVSSTDLRNSLNTKCFKWGAKRFHRTPVLIWTIPM